MKEKWSAYWITGIFVLLIIGAIGINLDKPQKQLEIMVLTEPNVTEITVTEITNSTVLQTSAAAKHQSVATASETKPMETMPLERNLNRAGADDLKRVAGIGNALAEAIIAERTALGGFTSRMELCEIKGIGEELMQRIMTEFEIPDEAERAEPAEIAWENTDVPETSSEESIYYIKIYDANTVTREELLTLPDMTAEMADAILTMRNNLKGYHGIYEISLAEEISGVYFENVLKQYLYVEGDPYSIASEPDT